MREHVLKTWPEPFAAVLDGRKRYEIRVDDRGFAVGDVLVLREWEPVVMAGGLNLGPRFTRREVRCVVTYLSPGGSWGLPARLCVMSIEKENDHGR